jgi:hypothetical protein
VDLTLPASGSLNASPSGRNRSSTTDVSRETKVSCEIISGLQTGVHSLAMIWRQFGRRWSIWNIPDYS